MEGSIAGPKAERLCRLRFFTQISVSAFLFLLFIFAVRHLPKDTSLGQLLFFVVFLLSIPAVALLFALWEKRLCRELEHIKIVDGRLYYKDKLVEGYFGRGGKGGVGIPYLIVEGKPIFVSPILAPLVCPKVSAEEKERLGMKLACLGQRPGVDTIGAIIIILILSILSLLVILALIMGL